MRARRLAVGVFVSLLLLAQAGAAAPRGPRLAPSAYRREARRRVALVDKHTRFYLRTGNRVHLLRARRNRLRSHAASLKALSAALIGRDKPRALQLWRRALALERRSTRRASHDRFVPAHAKRGDLDAIYQIERLSFSRIDAYDKKSLGALTDQTFVVRAGGRAVADLVYEIDRKSFGVPSLYIIGIATHPSWRGHGLGTRLLRHAEQHAAQQGLPWVYLHVRQSNATARRLYRKLGYRVVGTERRYYHDGEDAAIMRKPVAAAR